MVEERTGGKVKFEVYPAGTLAKGPDIYDAVLTGLADAALNFPGYTPGRFPLTEVLNMPFIGITTAEQSSYVLWGLYQKFPEMRAEYSDVKMLFPLGYVPSGALTTKPIRTLEDCQGLKLRSPGSFVKAAAALGFVPLSLTMPATYEGLAKGVVDGAATSLQSAAQYRLYEAAKYFLDVPLVNGSFEVIMNLATWNRLPSDIQKIMDELGGEQGAIMGSKMHVEMCEKGKVVCEANGVEITTLSPEELARWRDATAHLRDEWVSDMEAKGLPGKVVLEEVLRLAQEYAG